MNLGLITFRAVLDRTVSYWVIYFCKKMSIKCDQSGRFQSFVVTAYRLHQGFTFFFLFSICLLLRTNAKVLSTLFITNKSTCINASFAPKAANAFVITTRRYTFKIPKYSDADLQQLH